MRFIIILAVILAKATRAIYNLRTDLLILMFCNESSLSLQMIDASYHTNPSLKSTAVIISCVVVLLVMAAVVTVVFWK